ncbi:aminotransferase, class V [Leptospira fainei serovar Hurstbridge str. BUT 6]|uniref:Aminotransferase, class V n=1 Tax=Leptospira fainei serovar Hurstbridge str. BUT 6 TaxID=1193011 RepID=S3V2Z1_9LEPT|nr:aminotransferase class V-fold PLP-dependent enzyme [Leptospira fainei]EPG75818.1 aminotransferase, class V [Leptospira fainei serovar Hurstbridge str. BUT 6]
MKRIKYFDYNATHPPYPGLLVTVINEYEEDFFNPSGPTRFSLGRQGKIEEARKTLGKLSGKDTKGFVFCSTGTEANYLLAIRAKSLVKTVAYLSPYEHSSFYEAMENAGIRYEKFSGNKSGLVSLREIEEKLTVQPGPVFIIHAGNESGVVQPLQEIGRLCEKFGERLFSDTMQSFGKISVPFEVLSGFTFSGHKIGGGLGTSVLWFDPNLSAKAGLFKGGNQENGFRAGTENSPSIIALAEAAKLQFSLMEERNIRLLQFRAKIESALKEARVEIVAESSPRLPSTTFCILPTEDLDFFMMGMEERGFALSTGSSCKSRSREPAPSLLEMGYTKEEALRAVRISTGSFTTEEEVDDLIKAFLEVLKSL